MYLRTVCEGSSQRVVMADASCHRLLAECRERDDSHEMYRRALQDVAGKVDFSHVKSCVACSTADGNLEMEFARRLLPNLSLTWSRSGRCKPASTRATSRRWNIRLGDLGSELERSWQRRRRCVLCHLHIADQTALFQKLIQVRMLWNALNWWSTASSVNQKFATTYSYLVSQTWTFTSKNWQFSRNSYL